MPDILTRRRSGARPHRGTRSAVSSIVAAGVLVALGARRRGSIFAVGSGGASVLPTDDHAPRFAAGAVLPSSVPVPSGALFVAADARSRTATAASGRPTRQSMPPSTGSGRPGRSSCAAGCTTRASSSGEASTSRFSPTRVRTSSSTGASRSATGSADGDTWTTPWTAEFDSSPSYTRGGKDGDVETWTLPGARLSARRASRSGLDRRSATPPGRDGRRRRRDKLRGRHRERPADHRRRPRGP